MDVISTKTRSAVMSRVRSKNTKPELTVRKLLHRSGYRFRLHRKDLPGKPDIVLPKFKTVVFINGCFWHGHSCPRGKRPTTNTDFWNGKLDRNIARDARNYEALKQAGWKVVVLWECEIKSLSEAAIIEKMNLTVS